MAYRRKRYVARRRPGTYVRRYKKGMTRKSGLSAYRFRQRRGAIRPEMKYHDVAWNQAFYTGSYLNCINMIAQGTGASQRIGRRITIKSIRIRGTVSILAQNDEDDALYPPDQPVAVSLVLDRQCNGALPATTDVFTAATSNALPKIENDMRFKILWDKFTCLNFNAVAPTNDVMSRYGCPSVGRTIEMYKKCNINVEYGGTGSTISDIVTNSLLLFLRNGTTSTLAEPYFSGYMRIRYVDA